MKPAPFDYYRPESVADALEYISRHDDAKFIAGGQSLLAMMNFRLARPSHLVDVGALRELARVFDEGDSLLLGALCTHREVETSQLICDALPIMAAAARHIGHIAIRNEGTLGGTLAHGDAAAELPAVLLTLGATLFVEKYDSPRREIAIEDMPTGFYTTALEQNELITWVRIPKPPKSSGWGFAESARRHGDFAEAGCATVIDFDSAGKIRRFKLSLFGIAETPILIDGLEVFLDQTPSAALWSEVAENVSLRLEPLDQPEYRRRLASVCIVRACTEAMNHHQEEG